MRVHVLLCLLMFHHVSGINLITECLSILNIFNDTVEPEMGKNVPEIITIHGYTPQIHNVTTKDGYILQIHRVCPKNGECSGIPALLQHGLLASSSAWVLNTPDKNLPYLLLKQGFDVWLGNIRGNEYGQNHVKLDPNSKEFWEFSWDEMAKYDFPAMIDYVLKINGANKIYLVGHSMGTTLPFSMLSTIPEYNDKVEVLAALAPTAFYGNTKSPLKLLSIGNGLPFTILQGITNGKLALSNPLVSFLLATACIIPPVSCLACSSLFFAITGPDYSQMNMSRLNFYLTMTPSDVSANAIRHYLQEMASGKFCMFDHGPIENMKKYNQSTPPDYDMTKITTKVALFWGNNDWMADPTDVAKIPPLLGSNMVLNYKIPYEQFAHPDFVVAVDVVPLCYNKILELFHNVSSGVI